VPGDKLEFKLKLLSVKRRTMKMAGEAYVDGQLVAEAELLATVVDKRA
jgi:3-hydroxymyristoyl/3-hydroxydecanoyl-(acyl carrier protein) dehydratase